MKRKKQKGKPLFTKRWDKILGEFVGFTIAGTDIGDVGRACPVRKFTRFTDYWKCVAQWEWRHRTPRRIKKLILIRGRRKTF